MLFLSRDLLVLRYSTSALMVSTLGSLYFSSLIFLTSFRITSVFICMTLPWFYYHSYLNNLFLMTSFTPSQSTPVTP